MSTRKEFIKQMMMLSGAAGMSWTVPKSLKRAVSIDPRAGSSFMDAEHVVILMQENRSFDHCFGSLQGVRGYNDPRTITQPNGNSVWLQSGNKGHTYAPFRFDINDTKVTWMGSTPHNRHSQIDAWNDNKYNGWIEAKRSGNKHYADIPLTMGHYTREDLPFNYAMADAFTICDQNFCGVIGPTWTNRLFFWTGTNRQQKSGDVKAVLRNHIPWGSAQWKTMPEWLEENDIPWRIYQNDLTTGGGLSGQQRAWLANYGCNPLEFFSQYNVRFSQRYVQGLKNKVQSLPDEIKKLKGQLESLSPTSKKYDKIVRAIPKKKYALREANAELKKWSQDQFEKLPQTQKNLFNKAFTTNSGDPDYHSLTELQYRHDGKKRSLKVPKGDFLYQFRKDVNSGNLPTVSWLVPSHRFSDHPSSPWYGAWFTSEILDVLTKNPEVWKKTIFILTYDENDGYYDHVVPFTAPDPKDEKTGKSSPGIDVSGVEYTYREQRIRNGISKKNARSGPIGLGFRVPMIIASPWSRGGRVCSQVFDHTSTLQFLENFINEKYDKQIQVSNISDWRRAVSGNLTSAFQEYEEGDHKNPKFLKRDAYIEKIYDAKFKEEPSDYKNLSDKEIQQINRDPASSPHMPKQEPGARPSCGLPYELYADGWLTGDKKAFQLRMEAGDIVFGSRSAGAPFKVYALGEYLTRESEKKGKQEFEKARAWDYAVTAGDSLTDTYPLSAFKENEYHLQLHGPNGFFRELKGSKHDPPVSIRCSYEQDNNFSDKLTGNLALYIINESRRSQTIQIADNAYGNKAVTKKVPASGRKTVVLKLDASHGWYDITVKMKGNKAFSRRYAGRVETGEELYSDPAMGRDLS
jgi:phospholipase C